MNAEKRRVLALIGTHVRALEKLFGYNDLRTQYVRFVASEIERNAHRGEP